MDIPLFNSDRAPKPREEIRIEQVEIVSYPDRFRVYVHLVVTPFMERPNLLLVIRDRDQRVISELSIIETMHQDMEFTIHLRNIENPVSSYTLTSELFYDTRNPPQDRRVDAFEVPDFEE